MMRPDSTGRRAVGARVHAGSKAKIALALGALAVASVTLGLHFGMFSFSRPPQPQLTDDELAIQKESDALSLATLEKARHNPNVTIGQN
jgi:hypothetical protein